MEDNNLIPNIDKLTIGILGAAENQIGGNKPVFKNKWFDYECWGARKRSFRYLKLFRNKNSAFTRLLYTTANRQYSEMCRRKKVEYFQNISARLEKINDSKQWWALAKELKGHKLQTSRFVTMEEFVQHFRMVFNPILESSDVMYAEPEVTIPVLDTDMEIEEVINVIAKMKGNKAPGPDRIPIEFYKNASISFIEKLVITYNRILNEGQMPESFTRAITFPLYKKGDINDVSNYRGITFMDAMVKIFVSVLYERLAKWERQHQILNEFQAGFREGYGTVDNIFNLFNIIHLLWNRGIKKIYCCFVDFKAAFDSVDRRALFYKLFNCGVSTKLVNTLRNLYRHTKVAIWDGESLSEYFETGSGVKQGCPGSPILFAFFLNDLHESLGGGIQVGNLNIRTLMYADDIVIMADEPKKLQNMIHELQTYCKSWKLVVNLDKSKIMIFSRGGGRRACAESWTYNGEQMEVVSSYKYLGVTLTPKLSFKKHLSERLLQAKGAITGTWQAFVQRTEVAPSEKFKLFQAVSRSVMCYGAEIWGFEYHEEVERLQRFFIKKLIGLPKHTPNYMLGLETGVGDIFLHTLRCHLRYLHKVVRMPDHRLPKILAYEISRDKIFWYEELLVLGIRHNMNMSIDPDSLNFEKIRELIVCEERFQWDKKVDRARQGIRHGLYSNLNYVLGESTYFRSDFSIPMVRCIFKCRGSLLPLNRYRWSENENPECTLCNLSEEEDIVHFLAKCPILAEFRRQCFNKGVLTKEEVMESLNGKDWQALYMYINMALKYRQLIIDEFD